VAGLFRRFCVHEYNIQHSDFIAWKCVITSAVAGWIHFGPTRFPVFTQAPLPLHNVVSSFLVCYVVIQCSTEMAGLILICYFSFLVISIRGRYKYIYIFLYFSNHPLFFIRLIKRTRDFTNPAGFKMELRWQSSRFICVVILRFGYNHKKYQRLAF